MNNFQQKTYLSILFAVSLTCYCHVGAIFITLVDGGNRNQRGLMVQIAESKVGEHLMAFSINNLETATSIFNRCFPDTKIKGEKRKLNPYKYKIIHLVVIRGYSMR